MYKNVNWKLIFPLLTLLLMPALILNASGDGETATDTNRKSLIAEGEYTLPIVKEKMTLSYVGQDSLSAIHSLNDNREIWQEIEKRTNIKIDWQCVYGGKDFTQSLNLRIAAAQDLPDLIGTRGQKLMNLRKDKMIVETADLIKKYAPNILRRIKESRHIAAAMLTPDNSFYALAPYAQMHTGVTNVGGVFYRLDWIKKLGLKEPDTLDDYYNVMLAFRQKDPNGNGKNDEVPFPMNHVGQFGFFSVAYDLNMDNATDGFSVDKNGKLAYDFVHPRAKEFFAFLKKMYDNEILQKTVLVKPNQRNQMMATNRIGMQLGNISHCEMRDRLIAKAGVDLSLGGYTFGAPPRNNFTGKRELNPDNPVKGRYIVVTSKCKHPEVAVRWVDYVWGSEEGQILTNFGIKDKTYYIGKDNKPHYKDIILNSPKGYNPQDALREYGYQPLVLAYQRADAFKMLWEKNNKIFNMMDKVKNYSIRKLPVPTMVMNEQDAEDFANIFTDLGTYRNEMILKFIMGTEPLDNFDKFVENIKKFNLDRIIEIYQNMYDRLQNMPL